MTELARHVESKDLDRLRDHLARNPGVILESLAGEHGVSLRTIVSCLPRAMQVEVPGDRFLDVMKDVSAWGPVTFIVHTADGVFEFAGPLPEGSEGGGFFNLHKCGGIGGHIRADRCASIVFLRRPFMGKTTASIQFFNEEGSSMFKIFVGRDASGELSPTQVDRFDELGRSLAGNAS